MDFNDCIIHMRPVLQQIGMAGSALKAIEEAILEALDNRIIDPVSHLTLPIPKPTTPYSKKHPERNPLKNIPLFIEQEYGDWRKAEILFMHDIKSADPSLWNGIQGYARNHDMPTWEYALGIGVLSVTAVKAFPDKYPRQRILLQIMDLHGVARTRMKNARELLEELQRAE